MVKPADLTEPFASPLKREAPTRLIFTLDVFFIKSLRSFNALYSSLPGLRKMLICMAICHVRRRAYPDFKSPLSDVGNSFCDKREHDPDLGDTLFELGAGKHMAGNLW